MNFDEYKQGILDLNNEDNSEWINKVTCWIAQEPGYNIYIFQVLIENERELEMYYETITASIATEFQIKLKKIIDTFYKL